MYRFWLNCMKATEQAALFVEWLDDRVWEFHLWCFKKSRRCS